MKRTDRSAQNAFLEALTRAGIDDATVGSLARELEKTAAAHLWLANALLENPDNSAAQRANEAVEVWAQHLIAEHPGITGLRFMADPRGETVGLQLATGDSNSLTGTWKVPVDSRDFSQVNLRLCERYIEAVEQLERSPDAQDAANPSPAL